MTLAIMLATPYGVWTSTDHRLTAHPGGGVVTNSSVKHVVARCVDGAALVSYTGLGRVGRLDVSAWMRQVLRGESRTVDETLTDLREQATARFGLQALSLGVPHVFLVGAFIQGQPWAVEIRNLVPATPVLAGGLQPSFEIAPLRVEGAAIAVGGAGAQAVLPRDTELLTRIAGRRPRQPEEFMRLLGAVNRRAAESGRPGAETISRACTVVFMPPSGDGVKQEWYGPDEERHLAPIGISHVALGIDAEEIMRAGLNNFVAMKHGEIDEAEFFRRQEEAARRAIEPRGRRPAH